MEHHKHRETVAKSRILQQLIVGLEYKADIKEAYIDKFSPFFEKNVCGEKHPAEVNKYRNTVLSQAYCIHWTVIFMMKWNPQHPNSLHPRANPTGWRGGAIPMTSKS